MTKPRWSRLHPSALSPDLFDTQCCTKHQTQVSVARGLTAGNSVDRVFDTASTLIPVSWPARAGPPPHD
jgi:hypothetical protein